MQEAYDFIVVGGGNSGAALASRLSTGPSKPRILLLEGGGANDDSTLRHPSARYTALLNRSLNWNYSSIPQPQLDGRIIGCHRGRGLGGSSMVNFAGWVVGHHEDFNHWAEIVGDESWKWEGENGVQKRLRKIENFHVAQEDLVDGVQAELLHKDLLALHSKEGMVDLSFNETLEIVEPVSFQAAKEFEIPSNGDLNSGDPTGFGLGPSTYHNGLRVTSATAYLSRCPDNLTILTDTAVARVLFNENRQAIGVETRTGKVYRASKEVILSAGAFDTPKILLLSGIGPKKELEKFNIPVLQDLPGVGKNLKDHYCIAISILIKSSNSETKMINPLNELGLKKSVGGQVPMAFLSSSSLKTSPEFHSLPSTTQTHLQKVPSYEFMIHNQPISVVGLTPNAKVITILGVILNSQSSGSVTLSSSNPSDPPLIDPQYASHPYDRAVGIEVLRQMIKYSKVPAFADITEETLLAPDGESGEELWEHVKRTVQPVFHFGGTCKMGKGGDGDDDTVVVDREFRVKGVEGLRLVDHSVVPLMVNGHTMSLCYLIGELAAEKIIAEYSL